MKPYSSYKDSGVEWIGKIPNRWITRKGKYLFQITKTISGEEGYDVLSVTQQGIKIKDIISGKGQLSMDYTKYQIVNIGDFVMNHMDLLTGYVDISNYFGVTSPDYRVFFLTDKRCIERYYLYLLQMGYKNKIFYGFGQGSSMFGRWRLPSDEFNNFRHPYPDVQEQKQIVSFLDHKTQKIDELIKQTEKKIELLQEQRISLINHCVTKGLNHSVEMKDSGIEWIGEIPSHWNVKRVKYLLNDYDGIKIGPFGSSLKLDTLTNCGIKIYGQENVIKNNFQIGHRYLPIEKFEQDFTQYEIVGNDVLITMMGTTGKSKVFSSSYERGILDSHLLRLRFNELRFSGYLFSILLEQSDYIFQQMKLSSKGSIMEGLNSSIIKELKVLTPPISEQHKIVEHLDEHTQKIDSTIEKETQRIELLKEYRQSLISEVVTGKIDVRDWNNDSQKLS